MGMADTTEADSIVIDRTDLRRTLVGVTTLALTQVAGTLLEQAIFPTVVTQEPLVREFQCLVGLAFSLFLVFACMRRPRLLAQRGLAVFGLASALLAVAALALGPSNPALLALGCALESLASTWAACQCGVLFGLIRSQRMRAIAIAGGLALSIGVTVLVPQPPYLPGALVMGASTALAVLLPLRTVRPVVNVIAAGQTSLDLALANPRSFLGPSHQVFVLTFAFATASQLSTALCHDNGFAATGLLELAIFVGIGLWFVLARHSSQREDALFDTASLLVVGGMLLAILDCARPGEVSHSLLSAGNSCYTILSWLVVAGLCERNPAGSLYAVSVQAAARALGILVGATAGHVCSYLGASSSYMAGLVVALLLFGYLAYVQIGLRNFSFTRTIEGVLPAVPVTELAPTAPAAPSRDEQLARACASLVQTRRLTAREADVTALLCRGYNSKRIQEELSLSYNTVKTHAKHAYRKCDVHSQQELIALVEATAAQLNWTV